MISPRLARTLSGVKVMSYRECRVLVNPTTEFLLEQNAHIQRSKSRGLVEMRLWLRRKIFPQGLRLLGFKIVKDILK